MPSMLELCADLRAEHADLDSLVDGVDEAAWDTPTPALGWTVRDQVSHLAYFDDAGARSATDPDGFRAWVKESALKEMRPDDGDPADVALGRSMNGPELLERWRAGREAMIVEFEPLDPKARLPWFGPDMGAASFVTARLMETWAHGQDVADGLGVQRTPTDRLRHVCFIGVQARPYAYSVRGLQMPDAPLRVEVTSPSGDVWTFGPADASDVVRGPALDLALVVTQRRHRADSSLEASGEAADEWLDIAQAFAGPPGPGRQPGQFPR